MSKTNGSGRAGDRRATNRKLSDCTPAEACELLSSAISYMQSAGFVIRAGQRGGELVIVVPGAEVVTTETGATFRPATPDQPPRGDA